MALFFRNLLLDNLFLGEFFDDLLFRHFFDEMFLNKADMKSGSLKLPKLCVFGLKIRLFSEKRQKRTQFFSIDDTQYGGFDTQYFSIL